MTPARHLSLSAHHDVVKSNHAHMPWVFCDHVVQDALTICVLCIAVWADSNLQSAALDVDD